MLNSFKYGWSIVGRRALLLIVLFLYEITWGFLLFRYVKQVVVPMLMRYPGTELPNWSTLYWVEGQFRLIKTDMINGYLWTLLLFLLGRMILTPFINAGLFHAIHHVTQDQWKSFWKGIRSHWGRFTVLYTIQMTFTLLPLIWLIPYFENLLLGSPANAPTLTDGGVIAAAYIIYIALVRLCFMYIQFAATVGGSWLSAVGLWIRKLFPILALSGCIVLIALTAQGLLTGASLLWAGLTALIIYQAAPFVRVVFQIWEIAAQHDLWLKNQKTLP